MVMPKDELLNISLKPHSATPLYIQLYEYIVQQITQQRLIQGSKLPASRQLATQLGISRNTVQKAYEQLSTEGYVISKQSAGVFVNANIPDDYCHPIPLTASKMTNHKQTTNLPHYGDFTPGIPDLSVFPTTIWSRMCQRVLRTQYKALLFSADPYGLAALKQSLVDYLAYSRNVHCDPQQIIITNGAQEAINLTMRVLLKPHTSIAIENPGYRGAYHAIASCGGQVSPIPVLEDGIDLEYLQQQTPKPQLIYITPSHQYPLGATLSISKRFELLQYAAKQQSYIIEDDYDSEFHYKTKPLPALQGLDQHQRVIYLGTFSKVLFPAIRLGFLVVPPTLIPQFQQMKQFGFGQTPIFQQAVLHAFMQEGHLSRHIKRMRLRYAEKHQIILDACKTYLPPSIKIYTNNIGLHLSLGLPTTANEGLLIQQLNQAKYFPVALSAYYYQQTTKPGLVIGFSNTEQQRLISGICKIRDLINNRC